METYEIALQEYESEDNSGKHKLIYTYFGLAVYFSQCLEETFLIMLWTDRIIKKRIKKNKKLNEIIDAFENSKKTMGNFINEIKQSYEIPEALKNEFEIILVKRNYLIHKFFKLEIQKMHTDLGRKEMIKYCCDFIDKSKEMDEELKSFYSQYGIMLGLTEERLANIAEEMRNEEIEREKKAVNQR